MKRCDGIYSQYKQIINKRFDNVPTLFIRGYFKKINIKTGQHISFVYNGPVTEFSYKTIEHSIYIG